MLGAGKRAATVVALHKCDLFDMFTYIYIYIYIYISLTLVPAQAEH